MASWCEPSKSGAAPRRHLRALPPVAHRTKGTTATDPAGSSRFATFHELDLWMQAVRPEACSHPMLARCPFNGICLRCGAPL